jgi:hypothetical protein
MARSSFLFPSLLSRRRKLDRRESRLNRRPVRPQLESLERRDLLASFSTLEDTPLVVSDPNLLHAGLIAGPAHGKVSFSDAGGFTYTPAENYNGQDAFVYGFANTAGATTPTGNETAAITISSVNDPPSGADMTRQVGANAAYTIQASDFGFSDPKDNPANALKAVQIVTLPTAGKLVAGDVPVVTGQTISVGDIFNARLRYIPDPANTIATNGVNFTFAVQDNGGTANGGLDTDQTPNRLTIYLPPPVQPPKLTANPDTYGVMQNGALTIGAPGVLGNDTKAGDGIVAGSWTAKLKDGASHGNLTLNADGSFTYKPTADYFGPDSFTYYDTATYVPPSTNGAVSDPIIIVSNTTTVSIGVKPLPPFIIANNDSFLAGVNGSLDVTAPGILKNDYLILGDPTTGSGGTTNTSPLPNYPLMAVLVSQPTNGSLELHSDGSFHYVPKTDFSGPDTFTYQAVLNASASPTDPVTATSAIATVTINVLPIPPSPVAVDDSYSTPAGAPLKIQAPGVIGNDKKADGSTLLAVIGAKPANGNLEFHSDGSFSYTPVSGFTGADTFTYQDLELLGNPAPPSDDPNHYISNFATVTINVKPVVGTPVVVANNDSFDDAAGTALDVPLPGVLRNDYLTYVDPTTNAATTGNGSNTTSPLSAVLVTQPTSGGSVELHSDGSFHYVPKDGFTGPDTFTYQAILNSSATAGALAATSAVATVTINVKPIPPSPVAVDDSYSTPAGITLKVPAPGVTGNDMKAGGATLLAVIGAKPANGSIEFHSDGSFSYTPVSGFTGTDTFTYQDLELLGSPSPPPADPNHYISNFATVTINVKPIVTKPVVVANNDSFDDAAGRALDVQLPGVLKNDYVIFVDPTTGAATNANGAGTTSPPTFPLSAVLVSGPTSGGTLELHSDGSFHYVPKDGFTGQDTFTYRALLPVTDPPTAAGDAATANDATLVARDVATVTINVKPVVPRPVAVNDTYGTPQDTPLKIDAPGVLGNDKKPDGSQLAAIIGKTTSHGNLEFHSDGSFSYTPTSGYSGPDSFTYQAVVFLNNPAPPSGDPNQYISDPATVTIYVKAPPGPVAVNDYYLTAENTPLGIGMPGVLTNDYIRPAQAQPGATDPASPIKIPLTAVLVAGPTNGSLSLNADGSFKYMPKTDFVGIDTFTYQDSEVTPTADGTASDVAPVLSNVATVSIRVVPAVAHNDSYATDVNTALDATAPGVLGNDSGGSAAHPLLATLLAAPMHGKLTLDADGSFHYEPATDYSGPDVFTYRASDGTTTTNPPTTDPVTGAVVTSPISADLNRPVNAYDIGIVKIYVRPPAPVPHIEAHNDKYLAAENTTLTIDAPGVLANDYGPVNVPVIAALVDKPTHGTVTLNDKGDFTYIPETDYVGEDKFTYSASAVVPAGSTTSAIKSGLATVVIYVAAPNAPPTVIIGGDQTTTDESGPQKVTDYAAVVAVDSNGAPATVNVSTDKPSLFSAPPSIDPTGQLIYTPAPNASGTATITVTTTGDPTTGDAGDTQTFTIYIDKPHAFTNTGDPCDVTDDETVAADDALSIINYINAHGSSQISQVPTSLVKHLYYDVDKDNWIAAIDVLVIINYINAHPEQSAPATDANIDSSLLTLVAQDAADAATGKKKT